MFPVVCAVMCCSAQIDFKRQVRPVLLPSLLSSRTQCMMVDIARLVTIGCTLLFTKHNGKQWVHNIGNKNVTKHSDTTTKWQTHYLVHCIMISEWFPTQPESSSTKRRNTKYREIRFGFVSEAAPGFVGVQTWDKKRKQLVRSGRSNQWRVMEDGQEKQPLSVLASPPLIIMSNDDYGYTRLGSFCSSKERKWVEAEREQTVHSSVHHLNQLLWAWAL